MCRVSEDNGKNAKRVFVVHGRNLGARDAMFGFLRAIGLEPIEWSTAISATGSASPYIGQALDAAFESNDQNLWMSLGEAARLGAPSRG